MATKRPAKSSKTTKPAAATPPRGESARASASPQEIRRLIEEAAYYKAKERNFEPGHELDDWFAAEAEVRRRLEGRA